MLSMQNHLIAFFVVILLFACNTSKPMTLNDLSNSQWELVSYRNSGGEVKASAIDQNQPATLHFDAEGKIGGHSGCNAFGGEPVIKDGRLQASLFSTKRYCKEMADQENTIMSVFETGAIPSKKGELLVLTNEDHQLVYRPTKEKAKSLAVETNPKPTTYTATAVGEKPSGNQTESLNDSAKALPQSNRFVGLFRYMADAALFTSCTDQKRYAVELSGAFADCEKAYNSMNKSGAPAFMVLDGEVVKNKGEGPAEILRITKLVSANTTSKCK